MRTVFASIVAISLSLVTYAASEAEAADVAKELAGGFNPVPYLAPEVDRAREAYDDAQANRDLAMEKLRATRTAYFRAMDRLGVKENAETQAAFDKAKEANDTAETDYRKARKLRDDASETFFKVRRAAEKALSDGAPQETPLPPPVTAPATGAAAASAPMMSQAEVDAAWHKWSIAQSKAWKARDTAQAAWDAAAAARRAAKAAPTNSAAISAYFVAVKKAQAADDAADAARAEVPTTPSASGAASTGAATAVGPVEAKTASPARSDPDKATAATIAADAARAAADDKAWKARIAAQAASDKEATARGVAKRAPTDANVSTYLDARAAARAAADAAAAAKAEADRVWKTAQADPVKDTRLAANTAYAAWEKIHAEERAGAGIDGPHPKTMIAWEAYMEAHRAAVTAYRAAPAKAPPPDAAQIFDDGNDPYEDSDLARPEEEPESVPSHGQESDRMVIDDVDPTPAGAAMREAESAQRLAGAARAEALKARPTKVETDAAWDKAMAAQRNAAAASARADAAIKNAPTEGRARTQERPGTSDAVARTAAQALADAARARVEMEIFGASLDAKAEAARADAAVIAAIDEVSAAQADAKAAHATKNTAREDAAWDKWRTAMYNRKWAHAQAEMRRRAWGAVFWAAVERSWREATPTRAAGPATAGDRPHTQERPGTGAPSGDSGWRTPSEGTHTMSPQRIATGEAEAPSEPSAEQMRRAQQLYKADSGQGEIFVPLPPAPAPALNTTVPIPARSFERTPGQPTRVAAPAPGTTPAPETSPASGRPVVPPGPTPVPVASAPTPVPLPAAPGFGGSWNGDGGCGFSNLVITGQGNSLVLQGIPGNGPIQAASDGKTAQAQGVVMYGKPNHNVTLNLLGNQLAFLASSSSGSCAESLKRQ